MQQVLVVGKGGVKKVFVDKVDHKFVSEVVGTDAPQNYLEAVCRRFHDPRIVIYVNEEGRNFGLPVYGVIKTTNESLCGTFVICSGSGYGGEEGLSDEQIEVVEAQLEVIPDGIAAIPSPSFKVIGFQSEEDFLKVTQRISDDLYEATRLET